MPPHSTPNGFARHITACNNARLPGTRRRFRIGAIPVGWVPPRIMQALGGFQAIRHDQEGVTLATPETLPAIAKTLAGQGLFRWRAEAFDVRAQADGPALAVIDRGALPSFGIQALGVHVNGLVTRPDGLHLWVARRASNKHLDPGKLDHIVAGGVPSGLDPWQTLLKEAAEEASIPPDLAGKAVAAGVVRYVMDRAEGLRRDCLFSYDLMLPAEFVPLAADGEVESFELWPIQRAAEAVRDTDDFKFNVNLVLIDLFIRHGLITGAESATLRSALAQPPGG